MSGYGQSISSAKIPRIRASNKINRARLIETAKPMKLSIKERIRNWLMRDDHESNLVYATEDSEGPNIQSQGFRLNVYGASGGTIVETTKYDRKNDDHRHSLHVITDDKDLGESLSRIITMEQLR